MSRLNSIIRNTKIYVKLHPHAVLMICELLFFLLVVTDFSAFWSSDIYVVLQAESSSGSQEQVNPLIWISTQVDFSSVIAQEMVQLQLCPICFLRSLLGRLLSCMTNIWHMWPTVLQITLSFTRYIQLFTVAWLYFLPWIIWDVISDVLTSELL